MKKIIITLASLLALLGCGQRETELVNPEGFVMEHFALEVYRAQTQPVAPDYASMDPLTMHFGFSSKDVDADIERLTKAGATLIVHEKVPGFEGAMMKDPFGISIQFVKREKSVLLK